MNFYERHIGDYIKDTAHLSLLEHGVYSRLLDVYYTREGPIPVADAARLVGARSKEERAALEIVLAEFFQQDLFGNWVQVRCNQEIERFQDKQRKAKASAHAGVAARREKEDLTNRELRSARMEAARAKGTHTEEQWAALRHACGYLCVRCREPGDQQRDHIRPVYQGGSDGIDNIQPLCAHCNAAKGSESIDHRPSEWQACVAQALSERPHEFERTLNERSASHARPQSPVPSPQYSEAKLPRSTRGSRLPVGWEPGTEGWEFAASNGLTNGSAKAEFEQFRDHWAAAAGRGATKLDWQAAWRTWVRNALKFQGKGRANDAPKDPWAGAS